MAENTTTDGLDRCLGMRHWVCVRLLKVFLVLGACLHLTGGHYGVLQCVAWAGMWWSYSEESGWAQAAEDTFSGEKPCSLCNAIADAKERERGGDENFPASRDLKNSLKDFAATKGVALKQPVAVECEVMNGAAPDSWFGSWLIAPPLPPPRSEV